MAIRKTVTDILGRNVELYIRLNSAEVSNHGVNSNFLFRGYESEEAFRNGGRYLWEEAVSVVMDVSQDIWSQAYMLIKDEKTVDV